MCDGCGCECGSLATCSGLARLPDALYFAANVRQTKDSRARFYVITTVKMVLISAFILAMLIARENEINTFFGGDDADVKCEQCLLKSDINVDTFYEFYHCASTLNMAVEDRPNVLYDDSTFFPFPKTLPYYSRWRSLVAYAFFVFIIFALCFLYTFVHFAMGSDNRFMLTYVLWMHIIFVLTHFTFINYGLGALQDPLYANCYTYAFTKAWMTADFVFPYVIIVLMFVFIMYSCTMARVDCPGLILLTVPFLAFLGWTFCSLVVTGLTAAKYDGGSISFILGFVLILTIFEVPLYLCLCRKSDDDQSSENAGLLHTQ